MGSGAAVSRRLASPPDRGATRLRRRLLLVVAIVLLGLLTHSTYAGTGDEPHYLAIANSLAFDFDLDVANNYGDDEWVVGGVAPGMHVVRGRDGTIRPVHDVGLPLLLAPYVAVMHPLLQTLLPAVPAAWLASVRVAPATVYRHALSAFMIAIAVLLANQLFQTLIAIGVPPPVAFGAVCLAALSPPLSIHSLLLFTELLSALLCLVAFHRLVIDERADARSWAIAGLSSGLLILVHMRNVGLVAALLVLAAVSWRRRGTLRSGMAFVFAFTFAVVVRTAITHHLWGTWITTHHAVLAPSAAGTASTMSLRLGGLLLDQEYGLLWYAPVFILAPLAAFSWPREQRRPGIAAAFLIAAYLLPILSPLTNVHGWTGGWAPAARYLVPVVPLLAIGVAIALKRTPRLVAAGVVALQIVISAYFWQAPKNLWNDGDGFAAVCERSGRSFCHYLPSFVQPADAVLPP